MSGEELASRLNAEQGYFVAADERQLSVGFIISAREQCANVPIRVLGPSTRKEFVDQAALAHKIAPEIADGPPFEEWAHYYRVEAAD